MNGDWNSGASWSSGMPVDAPITRSPSHASTNALSKAAHDLARARNARPRTRRAAASCGYVFCEVAKEVPYYAGAFGATLVTDAVSGGDAIHQLARGPDAGPDRAARAPGSSRGAR